MNVFAQLAEPKQKDGIWIKTEEVISTEEEKLEDLTFRFMQSVAIAIDDNIFLFGNTNSVSSVNYSVYKYDIVANEYTRLTSPPISFLRSIVINFGTNIFLLGNSEKYAYKYDTLTNTYTQLNKSPTSFVGGSAVAIGTNIYIFNTTYAYKYDTLTDTYTQLKNIPYIFGNGCALTINNDDIYLIGGNCTYSNTNNRQLLFKYNISTETYTRLVDIPKPFTQGSAITINTDIYILGGNNGSDKKQRIRFNTITNTYELLNDLPYSFSDGSAVAINTNIYMFGSSTTDYEKYVYRYDTAETFEEIEKYDYNNIEVSTVFEEFVNENIYILDGMQYKTKILNNLILNFYTAFLYKDNKKQKYPVYCRKPAQNG